MKLLSVNVGQPREVLYKGRMVATSIFKSPVSGRVMLRTLNIDGDKQADLSVHGGRYKAAYVYPHEHYAYWSRELGRDDFTFGQFGENLTIEGLTEQTVHIGDVFRIGAAIVQVTQPRVPCFKLGIRMGDAAFQKQFHNAGRTGFYVRVLDEGEIGAGDAIERIESDPHAMSVYQIFNLLYHEPENVEDARRALELEALAPGWRESFAERVAQADPSA